MKTAIIIDSTAYANEAIKSHPDIYELKLTATFEDGTEFEDSTDLKIQKAFYDKLQSSKTLPKTSQPSPGEYILLVKEIIEKGYDQLLCIHLSQTFSGTYQTARMVTSEFADQIKIHVIDSKGVSLVIGALVEQALDMIDKGVPFEEICEKTEWSAKNGTIYLTVADLDNLVKGGRVSQTLATLGGVLKVRPLLYVDEEGKVEVLDKIRTDKKVNRRLAEIAVKDAKEAPNGIILKFAHAVDINRLQDTIEVVHETLPDLSYEVGTLGPVIGTHTGVGTVGMATIPKAD